MADVNFAPVEMDRCNQSVFVSAKIEYNPIINFIRRWKDSAHSCKTLEFRIFNHFEPTNQRWLALGMFFPELHQCFAGDDVHILILSQIEIKEKAGFSPALIQTPEITGILPPIPATTHLSLRAGRAGRASGDRRALHSVLSEQRPALWANRLRS